jgi:hypothetical protein
MAQILPAQNFGEISTLESAENAEFFHVIKNMYTQLAQNLIADQPPPPFLYRTPVKASAKSTKVKKSWQKWKKGMLLLAFFALLAQVATSLNLINFFRSVF